MVRILALLGLLVYFGILIFAVTRDKKSKNEYDFFFGGRNLPFWALSITFVASWWGAGSTLSTADLAFEEGLGAYFYYGVPVLISALFIILGSESIRKVGYLTQGEMMKERYSKKVSDFLSVMILIFMTFNAAAQMVGVGDFFGSYLGIPYEYAVILGTLIVFLYSLFGGFKAVVLTDIIQFVLLSISAVLVFFFAFKGVGFSFETIAQAAVSKGKSGYMDMFSGLSKYGVYVFTFSCSWMIQANIWQRVSATKNVTDAKKMAIMSFFAFIPLYLIVVFAGMSGIVLYDSLPEGGVVRAITTDYIPLVLGVMVFIGISAAIMSTMDSLINTGAMTMVMDLGFMKNSNDIKKSRTATAIVSLVAFLIAIRFRSILKISWLASNIITTGIFVPLVLGFVWKRGNSKGALFSMICGFIYSTYNFLIVLGLKLPRIVEPESAKDVILGMVISLGVYVITSLLTEPENEKAESFMKKAGIIKGGL